MWVTRSIVGLRAARRGGTRARSSTPAGARGRRRRWRSCARRCGSAPSPTGSTRRQVAVLVEDLAPARRPWRRSSPAAASRARAPSMRSSRRCSNAAVDGAGRDVAEQLVGQLAVGPREQRLGGRGDAVDPLAAALLARRAGRLADLQQPGVGEPGEVLAGAARRSCRASRRRRSRSPRPRRRTAYSTLRWAADTGGGTLHARGRSCSIDGALIVRGRIRWTSPNSCQR